jgi:citrate synthase
MRIDPINPPSSIDKPARIEVPPGLKGVIVTETELGDVRGGEGFFHYRQYSAIDLARGRSFEDVWYLMFQGALPDTRESLAFKDELAGYRQLDAEVAALLPGIAKVGAPWNPLDGLRTALSLACTARGLGPCHYLSPEQRRRDALFVCAQVPILASALWRLRRGESPLKPDFRLGYAADYLRMVAEVQPTEARTRAIEQYLISTIDHGFNASTFTARVIAATGADVGGCVVGAIGAFSGPLHGGSLSRSLDTLDKIGSAENIDAWVRPRIEAGERIMGFGHAVYRTEDPRSALLLEAAERLGDAESLGGKAGSGGHRAALAKQVEKRVIEIFAELKPGREIRTNVEFYAGVLLDACGVPRPMFTSTFATSRVIGWCANILEQATDSHIIRPSAKYVGPAAPQPVPAADAA